MNRCLKHWTPSSEAPTAGIREASAAPRIERGATEKAVQHLRFSRSVQLLALGLVGFGMRRRILNVRTGRCPLRQRLR